MGAAILTLAASPSAFDFTHTYAGPNFDQMERDCFSAPSMHSYMTPEQAQLCSTLRLALPHSTVGCNATCDR
ncbi:hypothetical protein EVAR_44121_1 [Eumeta japonica]|uniref:Uncharacterized protein n=1 Tax=Eumeta variegata TaxID=151549 RepID=A0A4C1XKR6_EUMVA|nr:hypothetical protein EVAR_44121_1 [Eumeta japonica]